MGAIPSHQVVHSMDNCHCYVKGVEISFLRQWDLRQELLSPRYMLA